MKYILTYVFLLTISYNNFGQSLDTLFLSEYTNVKTFEQVFTLDFNRYDTLSKEQFYKIFKCKNLRDLQIYMHEKWQIDYFNKNVDKLKFLSTLKIKGRFEEISDKWKALNYIYLIHLDGTIFQTFPKQLYELRTLSHLTIINSTELKLSCDILNLRRLYSLILYPINDTFSLNLRNYFSQGKKIMYISDSTKCYANNQMITNFYFEKDNQLLKMWYVNKGNHTLLKDDEKIIYLIEEYMVSKNKEEIIKFIGEPFSEQYIIDFRYNYKVQLKLTYKMLGKTNKELNIYLNQYGYIEYVTIN